MTIQAVVLFASVLSSVLSVPDDAVRTSSATISTDRYLYEVTTPVRVTFSLASPPTTGSVARLRVTAPDGKLVFEKELPFRDLDCRFDVPAGLWPCGNGKASVCVNGDGKELVSLSKSVRILKPKTRKVEVLTVTNGIPYLNGKPFFAKIVQRMGPIVRDPKTPREDILKMAASEFSEMRDMGINMIIDMSFVHQAVPVEKCFDFHSIHEGWLGPSHRAYKNAGITFKDMCDLASKYGLAVVGEIPFITSFRADTDYSQEEFDCFADEISFTRDCDNVVLWHPEDETDSLVLQNLLRRRLYAEADPDRITWANFCSAFVKNGGAAEILSADPYPVSPGDKDFSRIGRDADELSKVVSASDRCMWFWIQNFGAEPPIWPRPPDPRELRAMTYLALNHGAKGLAYFTYCTQRERNGVRQNPETIPELKRLNAEIERDKDLWLSGCRVHAGCVNGIDLTVIESGEVRRFSFVNATPTNQTAQFNVPAIGEKTITLSAYEQKIIDETIPAAVVRILPDADFPGYNLLTGCNVDFSQGFSGWIGEGTNHASVVAGEGGKTWVKTATRKNLYRVLPKGTYAPGDRLVAVCRVRAGDSVNGRAGPLGLPNGAGLTLAIWSKDWKKAIELHARSGATDRAWKRVVGTPVTLPEWVSEHNEFHFNLRNSDGMCEVADAGLYDAYVPAALYAHLPAGIARVRLVNERGETAYDSGRLSGEAKSFLHRLELFTPYGYRLTAIAPDGSGVTTELKPSFAGASIRVFDGMPSVRTVPHQLDALLKGGHIQGFCCSRDGVYLSHSMGIEMIDWNGRLIRRVDAPVHLGDTAYAGGRIYGAFVFWGAGIDGKRGMVRVWNERLEQVAEKRFAEQLDGITVLNGKIYVGVCGDSKPHRKCRIKVLDLELNELDDVEMDFGYDVAFGVQAMSTVGDELIFGSYGGTSIVSADLKSSRRIRLNCGEGVDRVPEPVIRMGKPIYVIEQAENGGMKQWMSDPTGHPPVVRLDFYAYENGEFRRLSK